MDKWGLVFAGGGGKGAYEIGAWKAIQNAGLNIQAVSGTSVGALNAALFACQSLTTAEKIWIDQVNHDSILSAQSTKKEIKKIVSSEISVSKTLTTAIISSLVPAISPLPNIITPFSTIVTEILSNFVFDAFKNGKFSRQGLEDIITTNNIFERFQKTSISCYACCLNTTTFRPEYFHLNNCDKQKFTEILLASSAIPFIFPTQKIGSNPTSYVDGGCPLVGDNVPIIPLCEKEGCNKIIVIHLDNKTPKPASLLPLLLPMPFEVKEILRKINKQNEFAEQTILGKYNNVKLYMHYPSFSVGKTLDFSPENIPEKINQGYFDTAQFLNQIF